MSKVIEGLHYSESHEWVKVEDGVAVIGISDFAQSELGDITYVDLPEVGDEVNAEEDFGAVESVRSSSDLSALEDQPELINEDPYGSWIIKVKMSDPSEVDILMGPEAYEQFLG